MIQIWTIIDQWNSTNLEFVKKLETVENLETVKNFETVENIETVKNIDESLLDVLTGLYTFYKIGLLKLILSVSNLIQQNVLYGEIVTLSVYPFDPLTDF